VPGAIITQLQVGGSPSLEAFVDDLDGSTEDVQNVRLSLDGANFEIDLTAANAARLRENSRDSSSTTPGSPRTRPARRGALSRRVCPGGTRSRRSGTGPDRTGMRCQPAGTSPRASSTPSRPRTETAVKQVICQGNST
jgi:hypothetical protein